MSRYDEFRLYFADNSAEQKLAVIRSESIRLLSTIQGYGEIILSLVEERGTPQMPDDFGVWCKKIVDNTIEMRDLIDAVTDRGPRSRPAQEQGNHTQVDTDSNV